MILSWFFENFFIANKVLWVLCGFTIILAYIGAAVLLCMLQPNERKNFLRNIFGARKQGNKDNK